MVMPFSKRIFNVFHRLFLVIFVILLNVFENDCNKRGGGLMFGYKGKSYSFITETCQGGIFFKKPISLDYLCPNGYFLQRSRGCSSKGEEIVGAEQYVCTDYTKRRAKVQALIPITNADYPTDHTVTLYDEPELLTGYRRYTIQSVARKRYIAAENGSSYILLTNPHNTHHMNIGRLCYNGIPEQHPAAYKLKVNSDFTHGESYGFFSKGCKEWSVQVDPSSGTRFPIKDGSPGSKRFSRAIPAKLNYFEDDLEVGEETHRVRKSKGGDEVFLDLKGEKMEDSTDSNVERSGSENEETTSQTHLLQPEGAENTNDPDDPSENGNPTDSHPNDDENSSPGPELEADDGDGVDPGASNEITTPESAPESTFKPISNKNATNSTNSNGEAIELNSTLKSAVIVDKEKQIVSPYLQEIVEIAKMYLEEVLGSVDMKGIAIEKKEESFLDEIALPGDTGSISEYIWYKILSASIDVLKTIAPLNSFPAQIESEAFRIFAYIFRGFYDDEEIIGDTDYRTLKSILEKLNKCASSPTMKPPTYDYNNKTCTPELSGISVTGWEWNTDTEVYQVGVDFSIKDISKEDWPKLLGRNEFQTKLHLYIEMMFIVFDIANMYCFLDFQEDLNAHSRMAYYMMQHVFVGQSLQNHWYSDELDPSIYLSLTPSWNGRSIDSLSRELDVLRYSLRKRVVPRGWIPRPDIISVQKAALSEQMLEKDDPQTLCHGDCEGGNWRRKSAVVSPRDSLPPPRRPKMNRNTFRHSAGMIGARSRHPVGKNQWLRRKRSAKIGEELKGREIWDGLAYCLSVLQIHNAEGQTKELGLEPSLQTLKFQSLC